MEKNSKEFFDYANKEYEKLLGIPELNSLVSKQTFRKAFERALYDYADRNPEIKVEGKVVRIIPKTVHLDDATNGIYRGYDGMHSVSFSTVTNKFDDKEYFAVNRDSNEMYGTKNNNGMPPMNSYSRSCDIYDGFGRVAHYYANADDVRAIPSEMKMLSYAFSGMVKKENSFGSFMHEESYTRDAEYPGIVNSESYHFRKKSDQSYDVKHLQSCYYVSLERPEEMNLGQPFYQIDLAGGKEIIPPTVNGKKVTLYDAKEYYNQIYIDSLQLQSQSKTR